MLYVVITAVIGMVAAFLFGIVQDWDTGAGYLLICLLIAVVGSLILAFLDDACDMFEKKVVSTTKKKRRN